MSGRLSSDHSRSFSQSSRPSSQRFVSTSETDSMHHRSMSARSSNPNVFSDEYSLEPIDSQSEHSTVTARSPSVSSSASSNTLRGSLRQQQKAFNTIPPTDAELDFEDPFADEARVSFDETPHRSSLPPKGLDLTDRNSIASTAPSITSRSQSASSRFSLPLRALSPYTGATGPSHPYAMYPQVGVSRSPSVATTSTLRPIDRPLEDTSAPQHPYAMYTQNVVDEEDGLDAPIDNSMVPLGFPGLNQAYQRAPGRADDDVGDLIGPDGHTEQLPPTLVEGTFATVNDAGITRDETVHDERAGPPMSEVSSNTLVMDSTANGAGDRGVEEPPVSGVMAFEEKLKSKGKKKACCGLPVWTLVLVGVVMLVGGCIGGIIGGVLGARKAAEQEHNKPKGPRIVTLTETPRMDATPVTATPTNLLTLPTGQFVIPASPKNQSKFCVADSDYRSSWGCLNSGKIPILVQGTDDESNITFEDTYSSSSSSLTYGAQQPVFSNPTQNMSMMMDSNDLSFGPALTFITLYDKLVVVPQDSFPSSASSKRDYVTTDEVAANMYSRKQVAQAGDKPWFCWWNSTVMEFFLYMNETTKEAAYSSSSAIVTATAQATQGSSSSNSASKRSSSSLPDYPRRIKMEEKRDHPGATNPYCQQMQVLDDGEIGPISQTTLEIKEVQPTPTTTMEGTGTSQTYTAKAQYESVCYCVSLTD
ncbi:hypothetical protein BO70DRAFT_367626 [Aspergillus heteromorphus CBS 117.55]|uniref:DUF7820 domain-containing protein n=1 Tax=Aspergillus heteromorphus CBS 117.55 TaxID=1448321 RepID=A0A317X4R3_9EURO|nr:uncharacterized protein BO70DRAFT_367626 [Aspergillus heteromorphus CBS 117.55]PWY92507.1 hypothetical protein BO70DRAFT_367626 [Aspergillus heteromorphus CBS 117.55]